MELKGLDILLLAVFGVVVAVFLPAEAANCPSGWKLFQSSCYFFSTSKGTVFSGQQYCKENGAHLVNIDSPAVFQYLKGENNGNYRWVGITDTVQNDRWVKLGTNEKVTADIPWYAGEPNDGNDAGCALMNPNRDNGLADANCYQWHFFICEKPLETPSSSC